MDNFQHIVQLILKKLKGELDEYETSEINAWLSQSSENQMIYEQLTNPELLQTDVTAFYLTKRNITEKIQAAITPSNVVPLWKKMIAAASVILVLGLVGYLFLFNKPTKQNEIVEIAPVKDVEAPKSAKAMITLADGRTIALDSVTSGVLAMQGDVKVVKLPDGKISYSPGDRNISGDIEYNIITNPKGSKVVAMTLSDGSHVWLNAGSSLKYPVVFARNERKVVVNGEGYFEVTHKSSMPFKVTKGGMEVTVLGTQFNVNAYDDESDIRVTLLEGSVKVAKGSTAIALRQGQQAQVTNDVRVVNGIDLEEVMAWKNGFFKMKGTDLGALMRQIARWYDVQVEYERPLPQKSFGGSINRDVNLSDMLSALEKYGIFSRMEKGKVIVQ